ncbi:DUF5641 domain-containing protein [Trichonephila clavipes]|nr:DUF5641 domain-containing protein [Trichonephila clavipes]
MKEGMTDPRGLSHLPQCTTSREDRFLKTITKTTILNFEELTTLLCQIEACLNSRPLTPLSSDPLDVRALTPVVIHDPQAPPLQWKLGRINCTHPGPDVRVRVVSIQTQDGEIQRPISKVTLLLPAGENVKVSQDYKSKSYRQRVIQETGDCLKELL